MKHYCMDCKHSIKEDGFYGRCYSYTAKASDKVVTWDGWVDGPKLRMYGRQVAHVDQKDCGGFES